jgi:hypothetical protein
MTTIKLPRPAEGRRRCTHCGEPAEVMAAHPENAWYRCSNGHVVRIYHEKKEVEPAPEAAAPEAASEPRRPARRRKKKR